MKRNLILSSLIALIVAVYAIGSAQAVTTWELGGTINVTGPSTHLLSLQGKAFSGSGTLDLATPLRPGHSTAFDGAGLPPLFTLDGSTFTALIDAWDMADPIVIEWKIVTNAPLIGTFALGEIRLSDFDSNLPQGVLPQNWNAVLGASSVELTFFNLFNDSTLGATLSDAFFTVSTPSVSAVPLPAALPLYGVGIAVLVFVGWQRKKRQSTAFK